jgi:STE24 endopeptidase
MFFASFLSASLALATYFGGLIMYHAGSYYQRRLPPESEIKSCWRYAFQQIMMWLPFVLPFLLFVFAADSIALFSDNRVLLSDGFDAEDPFGMLTFFSVTTLLVFALILFMPWLIQKMWLCKPLDDDDLWLRLSKVANHANFRFAGMRIWTVMNQFHSAAILGIFPRFRYVMFTKRLLNELPPESIEAILIHEIGHSYRKHLIILPFVIFGMFVIAGLFSLFFSESIFLSIQMQNIQSPSPLWEALLLLAFFVPYVLIFALYFRFVFGFYSRHFERQADLHPFTIGTSPEEMIRALDHIGTATGNTHDTPSWHHYSLRERMNFLKKAVANPAIVDAYHKKVRRYVAVYFLCFAAASVILISPAFSHIPLLQQVNDMVDFIQDKITFITLYFLT